MSNTTNPVPTAQEQQAAPAPTEAPETASPGIADKAAEAQAEAEAEQQKIAAEAEAHRKAAVTAFKRGEAEYRKGMMTAGLEAHAYIVGRLRLKHPRANAVKTLVGDFAAHASCTVDDAYVCRLITTAKAREQLAEGLPEKDVNKVPYGHYANAWALLVQRVNKDTPEESWTLLPGLESECKAAFAEGIKSEWPRETAVNSARALVAQLAERQRIAAEFKATVAESERFKAEAEKAATAEKVKAAQAEADKAKAEAAQASAESKERMTAAAAEAAAKLKTEQTSAIAAQAAAEQAARDKAKADKAAAEAAQAAQKAQDKAEGKKGQKGSGKAAEAAPPAKERATSAENLIPSAGNATAKDWAEMLKDSLLEHSEPEDVLEHLLTALGNSGEFSKAGIAACNAAILALHNAQRTARKAAEGNGKAAPAESNGKPTATAAA